MGLPLEWLSHLPQDSKERELLDQTIRNSTTVLLRFRDMLEHRMYASQNTNTAFDSPAWAEKQAFSLGMRTAYEELLRLMNFLDNKDT